MSSILQENSLNWSTQKENHQSSHIFSILVGVFKIIEQGGHKPGKPGKLREFEKLSKSQGNLNFCRKTWKTQGKCKIFGMFTNEKVSQPIFLSSIAQGKI